MTHDHPDPTRPSHAEPTRPGRGAAIRRAGIDDLDTLVEMHHTFCELDQHPFDAQRALVAFSGLLAGDDRGVVWIVDRPAAYAVVTWGWSIEAGGLEAVLDEVFVSEPGGGIGGQLIDHLVDDGRRRGLARIFLETETHNDRARRLYGASRLRRGRFDLDEPRVHRPLVISRRLAVVVCCLLAACADPTIDETGNATTTISAATAADRDAAALDSTVRVRAEGCGPRTRLGIGTIVDESLIVTAAHVVAGSERVEVLDRRGLPTTADVVAFDPDQDLALLRAGVPVGAVAVVRPDEPSAGEEGIVAVADDVGDALELVDATITRTVTVRTTDIYGDGVVLRDGFEIDASIEPGDSGTMVHFPGGVSGVVWARSLEATDRAWAVAVPPDFLEAPRSASPVDTGPCP